MRNFFNRRLAFHVKKRFSQFKKFTFIIAIFSIFITSCANEETLTSEETNSQLYSTAVYKARECGNPIPEPYPFTISDRIPQRNVDLCTFAILRSRCPFDGFPAVCILIYLEEFGEIPAGVNFGDFINERL